MVIDETVALLRDQRGSVTFISALSLPIVIGAIGFGVELSNAYAERVGNQSIADMAALAGADVYMKNKSQAEMRASAREIVLTSGLAASSVDTKIVDSPDDSGLLAVRAVVTTNHPYFFSRIFERGTSFDVSATAYAKLPPDIPPCIITLADDVDHGVMSVRGSGIAAPDCAIHSNDDVFASGVSTITANSISAHDRIHTPPNDSTIQAVRKREGVSLISDPLAGNADMIAAKGRIGTYTTVGVPSLPMIPAVGVSAPSARFIRSWWPTNTYTYSNGAVSINGIWDGTAWVFPAGTYNFDTLSVSERIAFVGPTIINVRGDFTNSWPQITIRGNGAINVGGNIQNVASVHISGQGSINVGGNINLGGGGTGLVIGGTARLNVGGDIINTGTGFWLGDGGSAYINIAGNLTASGRFVAGDGGFAILGRTSLVGSAMMRIGQGRHYFGPIDTGGATIMQVSDGDTDVNGKLNVGGSSSVMFGAGAFAITKDSWGDGRAILAAGDSRITFGDGPFSANGIIQTIGDITFGATASHYVNGDLLLGGNARFGSGAYYVNGNFRNSSIGNMIGTDVNFVLAGAVTLSGSANLRLAAPTTGGLKDFLFITGTSDPTLIEGAASSVLAGIIYAPSSALTLRSGGELSGGGKCWSLVARTVVVDGGKRANLGLLDAYRSH